MTPIYRLDLLLGLLLQIDAGTIQSKLLALLLLGLILVLLKIVHACWAWRQWAGIVAAALWAPLFVYFFS